ncbi:MAG: hypothetical protein WCX28_11405 [Bacteriovoracaceae bacterium]|nr:hypothetical protein [Bacteroidota bacterium]
MTDVFLPLVAFLLKTFLYFTAMKLRNLNARWMTAAMCGGSTILASYIPLPEFIHFFVSIALAGFFLAKDAEANIYPDGIAIPLVVEVISVYIIDLIVVPLMNMFL